MIKKGQGRISAYFSNDNVKESNICVKCGAVIGKNMKKCSCECNSEQCSCCENKEDTQRESKDNEQ